MSENRYINMTQKEKDNLCDGINFQNTLEQLQILDQRNQSPSLKRHRTNGSEYQYDDDRDIVNNDNGNYYQQQQKNSRYKKRNNYSITDQSLTTNSRTFTNSNSNTTINRISQQRRNTIGDSNDSYNKHYENHEDVFRISNQALTYAASTHLQPIKIECEPKMKDQKEAAKFIQHFFKFIEKDFYLQNINHKKPAGFEQWWIDKEGNIQGTTKVIDLYVFLCNPQRYPKEINDIKITPHPPKHLPPQRSVILKWIKNSISRNELKEELEFKFKSIYSIQDIIGTLNTRNRHVRIDFQDETEYNTILNSGKVSIYGQLIDCDEYLPAPKLLICSKCNTPGHTKRVCTYSQVELCRRCGKDRNGKEDHNLCEVKCHHCGGPHTSTDYSCPFIQKYRRELVLELRNRPDLLPAEAQLFIPTECRESGKITKILKNKSAQYQQFNKNQHYQSFNHLSSDHQNQWPSLPYSSYYSSKSDSNTNVNETIKSLNDELKTLKETYAAEQKKLEEKYKNHLNSMNQCWLIMQQQIQTQTEMFTSMDGIINSIVFSTCTSLMESLTQIVRKLKNDNNQNEFEPILLLLQQQLLLTNDKKSTYISHQMKLNQLAEKQRAVLDIALNSIIKQPNEL
ncbi:unnamed protein product [Rotaria sp. Silwood2]|nr:unnamed protein product [Rotaria sp. Silwood2]CAF3084212.1 unnamed protein product [Rotaria sp. Silwood2]